MNRYRFRYGGVWSSMMSENHALAFPLCSRDEPTSLLALRPQLPSGVPAEEGFHPGGHLQTGRVPLETGAGKRLYLDMFWMAERERERSQLLVLVVPLVIVSFWFQSCFNMKVCAASHLLQ